jgi:adenylate cyclase
VIGKEVPEPALRRVAGLDEDELSEGLKELIGAGFLYEAEIYPERVLAFSHPLTREVAYDSQLAEQRTAAHKATAQALIELNPDRHDELAALIAQHMEQGGETLEAARWGARAAYWAGHSQPREALRLWRKVTELADQLPESEESVALGTSSRMMQLDYAWRLGMEKQRADSLLEQAREMATRTGDLRSLSLLVMLGTGRPGVARDADSWIAGVDEAIRLADESGDDALRVAIRTAAGYAYLSAGRLESCERILDEALALAGDDEGAGAGLIINCPVAWAHMAKGLIRREQGRYEEAEELLNTAMRIAGEHDDPETENWTRGNIATLLAVRGDHDAAVAVAQRNYELTERLGDAFSRSWALVNLGFARAVHGDGAAGVDAVERADRLIREAMGEGGESEAWRGAIHAQALLAAARVPEALAEAKRSARVARERGMLLTLPAALRVLAEAKIALDEPGVAETLDQAAEAAREVGTMPVLEQIERLRESVETRA